MSSFQVTPTRVELFVPPGTEKEFEIALTNQTGKSATFVLGAEDLAPANNPEGDSLLLGKNVGPHSLKDYILSPTNTVTLADGETRSVSFVVSVPMEVTKPGLYGAVTIELGGNRQVQADAGALVRSRLAVGVLVSTVEQPEISGHLVDFETINGSHVLWSSQTTFKIAYQNDGNVHIEPTGLLSLSDVLGRQVAEEQIGPIVILPMSTRSQTLSVNSGYVPGRLAAHLQIEDGFGGHHEERDITLWIMPWQNLLVLGGLVVVVLLWRKAKKI